MQLSKLETETRRLLGGITSTEYSDADIDSSVNRGIHDFTQVAIHSCGSWQVNGEIATSDLTADQVEYVFPSSILQLHRIEVDYTGGTNTWNVPVIRDMRSVRTPLSNTTDSVASEGTRIRLYDNSLWFDDIPTTTITNGIKIYYSDEASELSNDTDSPNLPEFSHLGLVYVACLDFAIGHNLVGETDTFKALLEEKKQELREFYADKEATKRTRIRPRTESYE